MNKSKEENNQDIKPVRSEAVSNRGQRRIKGGSLLLSSTVTIINTIGLILLGLWFFNTSGSQQQAGKSFIERISTLEENIYAQSNKVDELIETNSQDLKFINKEIRKLWDLSNKRNRKNISQNLNAIEAIEEKIDLIEKEYKTISAKQRSLNLKLSKLEKMQENLNQSIEGFDPSVQDDNFEDRLIDLEEATESIDFYRTQVNQSILSIKQKLNELELEIINIGAEKATSNE
tara:strand:- start:9 stop:704 length:696 start_codon:yes stop_codon:yes gene_type:complete